MVYKYNFKAKSEISYGEITNIMPEPKKLYEIPSY